CRLRSAIAERAYTNKFLGTVTVINRSQQSRPVSCPGEQSILEFVDGRLAAERIAYLEQHLATCETCQELLAASATTASAAPSLRDGSLKVESRIGADATFAQGTHIGRYTIMGLVGRGGMSDVYAAYDPELNRKIALKFIRDDPAGPHRAAAGRLRLLREAKAIARLSHPNVVVVHDAGAIGDRVFIAMEFIEGETLAERLGGRPHAWEEVKHTFLAAGRGLAAAHAA